MSAGGFHVYCCRPGLALAAIVFLGVPSGALAQPATGRIEAASVEPTLAPALWNEIAEKDLADEDLGHLIEMDDVSVASMRSTSVREAPGVVTLLTREEIAASGARDLIDLLEMIPGFFVGVDVQGNLGLGMRGNWGQEGKILVLLDGQEINETAYGTLSIAHHFPVQAIERIEIIRGPGSAIYGGFAELGVVKITTRGAEEIEGFELLQRVGLAATRSNIDLAHPFVDTYVAAGRSYGDFELSAALFSGHSVQSEGTYTDVFGTSYDMAPTSTRQPLLANLRLAWRDWRLHLMADGFIYQAQDDFDVAGSAPTHYRFGGLYGDLTTVLQLGPHLTLTPRFDYKIQKSYESLPSSAADAQRIVDAGLLERLRMDRALASARLDWKAQPTLDIMAGSEVFSDVARAGGTLGDGSTVQGTTSLWTAAAFCQLVWNTRLANLTVGGRGEYTSRNAWSAVPRLALTHVFSSGVHVKLLASQAYKSPTFMNYALEHSIDANNRVRPERTNALEAEVGHALPWGLQLVGNGFLITINDPIIYSFDATTNQESYFNRQRTGTFGGEAELRWNGSRASLGVSYSTYHALSGIPADYRVEGGGGATLGAPQHKGVARASWRPLRNLTLGATAVGFSRRYAVTGVNPSDQSYLITSLAPRLLLGVSARYQDLGMRGLLVGITIHDLLDARNVYAQPYLGGHAPLPGVGRQFLLSLGYAFER